MCAGGFVEVYANSYEDFDCVASCFFLGESPPAKRQLHLNCAIAPQLCDCPRASAPAAAVRRRAHAPCIRQHTPGRPRTSSWLPAHVPGNGPGPRADTAHDIVEYLEVIHRCLKPGGYLVNLGPLMYHWYGDHREMSLEISLEEVLHVAGAVGFDIDRHAMHVAGYTNHPATMFRTAYNCAFTTFR